MVLIVCIIIPIAASTALPQPEIESSHRNVMAGGNFSLKCIVRVKRGTVLNMAWSYTSKEVSQSHNHKPRKNNCLFPVTVQKNIV